MNEQLPPIDPSIREHLTRRSSGRLPDGLADDVFWTLDAAPTNRSAWRLPRLVVAGMSLALVVTLAVAIGFSASRPAPAASPSTSGNYPTERAMTTAELASLMAGPATAVNTGLVASVTIDIRNDVCPMNRYPTLGVVAGMGSQVCVMTTGVVIEPKALSGTYAFRYLGPGYLLLLGQVTPGTGRLAFNVAGNWPGTGTMFLVEGSLHVSGLVGNDPLGCPGAVQASDGTYSCTTNWLSDSASARPSQDTNGMPGAPTGARVVTVSPEVAVTPDPAGGAATGVFVVESGTGPCPGASPDDSRGCQNYTVEAKVGIVVLFDQPAPPLVTTPPLVGYRGPATPLTTDQLAAALGGGTLPTNATLIASLTLDPAAGTCGPLGGTFVIRGIVQQVCVLGSTSDAPSGSGTFALRYLEPGYVGLIGKFTPASGLALAPSDQWPVVPLLVVDGWINRHGQAGNDPAMCPGATPDAAGNYSCSQAWLSDSAGSKITDAGVRIVTVADDVTAIDHIAFGDQHGVFVLKSASGLCQNSAPGDSAGCTSWRVVAKVADLTGYMASTSPPAVPPAPIASASLLSLAPSGLIGPNNRALTPAELSALTAADSNHLAGRYVIDMRVTCDGVDCSGLPPKAIADQIQPGSIELVGPVDLRPDGGLVWTVPQSLNGFQGRFIFIVDAWIGGGGLGDACDIGGQPCDRSTRLGSGPNARELTAQTGALSQFTPPNTPVGSDVRGLFLVRRVDNGKVCGMAPLASAGQCSAQVEILARLEPAVLP